MVEIKDEKLKAALQDVDKSVQQEYPQYSGKIKELTKLIEEGFGMAEVMQNPQWRKQFLSRLCQLTDQVKRILRSAEPIEEISSKPQKEKVNWAVQLIFRKVKPPEGITSHSLVTPTVKMVDFHKSDQSLLRDAESLGVDALQLNLDKVRNISWSNPEKSMDLGDNQRLTSAGDLIVPTKFEGVKASLDSIVPREGSEGITLILDEELVFSVVNTLLSEG